jgi:hypothetical protein
MTEDLLRLISNPGASEAELTDALGRLGPVTEPPGFWTRLAGSDEHSPGQRRHYVFQLLRRHLAPGMRLSALARLLDDPPWLNRGDIAVIEDLAGAIPVRMTDEDTVFRLRVAPGGDAPDIWAIYLRVAGKVTSDQLYALLRGGAADETTAQAEILEIGFSPPAPPS